MACCSAGGQFEDSVMTVHYLPITSASVTASKVVNNDMENPQIITDGWVSPEGRSTTPSDDKEEEDDVDYYAHERKMKKHRHWGDGSPGVYDTSFPMKL
jgi:hypothetical protein